MKSAATPSARPGPIPATERIVLLDVLRGFALLGILLGNLTWFTGFAVLGPEQREALGTASADAATAWLLHALVDGKFYSLFSLLFGVGFAVQSLRIAAGRRSPSRAWLRRMAVLFLFGAVHATLLWFGDILSLYALTGVFLLWAHARSDRALFSAALILLAAPLLLAVAWLALPAGGEGYGPASLLPAFGSGSYAEVLNANWAFLRERWFLALYEGRFLKLLGLFVLGYWVGRKGVFAEPASHRLLLARITLAGLLIGLPANLALAAIADTVAVRPPSPAGVARAALHAVGVPFLSIAYAAGITLLFQTRRGRRALSPLAPAGRMSLSNYLVQSVLGVALFYGCGLGAWGRMGAAAGAAVAILIFACQLAGSAFWLRAFRFGPAEWLWRCLTYGKLLPMRHRPARGAQEQLSLE